eukprot:455763_1
MSNDTHLIVIRPYYTGGVYELKIKCMGAVQDIQNPNNDTVAIIPSTSNAPNSTFMYTTSVTSDIKEMEDCDYYSNDTRTISSTKILHSINGTIEIQFDIQLNHHCNKICNILFIHRDGYFEALSLSINGIKNVFELSVTNDLNFVAVHKIPSANASLPVDNQNHRIYLLYSYASTRNMLKIDNFVYYYHSWMSASTHQDQMYQLYMSNPRNHSANGTVSNVCIKSPIPIKTLDIFEGTIKCGDTLRGELNSASDIDYYYFNLSNTSAVLFDSCGSIYDTKLSLYNANFIKLIEADDDGDCGYQAQLVQLQLFAGEYVIEISGYGDDTYHQYGEWLLNIVCVDAVNTTNSGNTAYHYILSETSFTETEWIDAEKKCESLGTTLATIISRNDMDNALNDIAVQWNSVDTLYNVSVWIGLYENVRNGNRWQWIDGTSCNYAPAGDCISDLYWDVNQPDGEPESTVRMQPFAAVLFISELGNSSVSSSFRDYPLNVRSTLYPRYLCNGPNTQHTVQNCTNKACWSNVHTFSDDTLNDDTIWPDYSSWQGQNLQPGVVYWHSNLYVIGINQIHQSNIGLFDNQYQWHHKTYHYNQYWNETRDMPYFGNVWWHSQLYTQYGSSVYIYGLQYNWGFQYNHDYIIEVLMQIDLDTLELKIISQNIPKTNPLVSECLEADASSVYLIRQTTILTYKKDVGEWITIAFSSSTADAITCALSNDEKVLYIFNVIRSQYYNGADLQFFITKYDTNNTSMQQLNISSSCMVQNDVVRSVTGRNGKIYLHGCYVTGWKSLVFNTATEQFENETIDIDVVTADDIPYYRSSQLTVFDDNILLLLYKNPISESFTWYFTVTDSISINFTNTQTTARVWPSDGFDIKYYLNDFTYLTNNIYHILFYSSDTTIHINTSIVLNTTNDGCICNETIYNCRNCNQHFDLKDHLTLNDNHVNQLTFIAMQNDLNSMRNLQPLILPKYITVKLQRCNISIKNMDRITNSDDPWINFTFALSNNCYSRIGTNFSLDIIAPLVNLSKELIISILPDNMTICKICTISTAQNVCFYCNDDSFVIQHATNDLNDGKFEIYMKSNMIDLNVMIPSNNTIQYYENKNTIRTNNDLWYLLFLLIIPCIIILIIYIYCKRVYMNAFIVDKALVLIIGIAKFDNDEAR